MTFDGAVRPSEQVRSETAGLTRESSASRVADALRAGIIEGRYEPGTRLSEERVREDLGVSRSTLREAFRLLIRERLLVHELSRGVFVRQLSRDDISDLYRVRRVVECAALRQVEVLTPAGLRRMSAAIEDGRRAEREGQWSQVAAASIRFHEALVGLADSPRLDGLITEVLAEFRLAYAFMHDTSAFHQHFLRRHPAIADAVRAGDLDGAAGLLDTYLRDAEREVLGSYATPERRSRR
ncbi:GntR family transcriptional regulator [Saccharopolyspora sp. K220]|uniref:GntR family transcriptional regulator n=1 Tax=Saccharopolyspora soli TaxID=2926618 RepID=UPI001F580BC7|nr:GntR family transcriptional regulator [Saccharopolyspora soli]MCI2417385.1 GntR family transcriptional regulator [Saccharopolyspora soli]